MAFLRIGLGAFAILATKRFARAFAGPQAQEDELAMTIGRLYGIREIAIGLATAEAVRQDHAVDLHIGRDLLVDASDGLFVLLGRRALTPCGRALGLAIAGVYTVMESGVLQARASARSRPG